ncbi:ATP-binding protein [Streptomyces sp. HUAS ZL42]|uniref:ATP-binding protein n=1 Tax=Streptomyces sp. HUAS ZL42 TaxID=3231715 RepID=UPI00345E5CAC
MAPLARRLRRRRAALVVRITGLAGHLRRAHEDDVYWPLDHNPRAPSQARRLIRDQLTRWGLDEQADTAELLVTELVTNALTHARGPIRLSLSRSLLKGALRCGINDASPLPPRLRHTRYDEEHGRGLHLVDELATRWGSRHLADGKTVWFELRTTSAVPRLPRLSLWPSKRRRIPSPEVPSPRTTSPGATAGGFGDTGETGATGATHVLAAG